MPSVKEKKTYFIIRKLENFFLRAFYKKWDESKVSRVITYTFISERRNIKIMKMTVTLTKACARYMYLHYVQVINQDNVSIIDIIILIDTKAKRTVINSH